MSDVNVPVGYKKTEIGFIPNDWNVAPLKSLLKEPPKYGINAPAVPLVGKLPVYIRITDITEDGYYSPEKQAGVNSQFSDSYILNDGDIVLARTGASVGKSYLYRKEDGVLVYAGFLIKVSPDDKALNPSFLFQYLKTEQYWAWVIVNSMRSGQPGVNGNEYGNLPIPVPNVKEQTAIANALSDVDNLLQSLEKLISKKEAIKTATMQQLLTGKTRLPEFATREDGSQKGFKQTDLGQIPEDWGFSTLGEIARINMGQSPKSLNYNKSAIGLPLVQGNADILNRKTIIRNYTSQITKTADKDDLILSVRAPVGEVAIADFNCCIGRGVCSIKYPNAYLYHWLIHFESQWEKFSKGSTFDSINSHELKAISLCIPFLAEQTAIATILSDMDAEIKALNTRLAKTQDIKQGMMQQLLTGKLRLPH
ncbi:restriction endonuclease subunit S [Psychrobacter sp. van23A]|uniref:restriction endonuclease subunit S n=1 Tax=Psychrobacter sp. van23A TaxID=3064892 RepID=UPI0027BA2D30|nr:restriction endonuclease subunit S [Psychrobacter sp. van23A]WLW65220.1 restriction endonuclease subunit S [Psychrobacter sp. van23A]